MLFFLSMPDLLLGQSAAQNGSLFSNVYESIDIPGIMNRNYYIWNPWLYAQDNYKVRGTVTLNLGLRYERIPDFVEKNGRNSNFDVTLADSNPLASGSQAGYVLPSNLPVTVAIPAGSVRLNNKLALKGIGQNTVGPRIGFGWQVLPTSTNLLNSPELRFVCEEVRSGVGGRQSRPGHTVCQGEFGIATGWRGFWARLRKDSQWNPEFETSGRINRG
jgi:hypothetical protein